MALRQKSAKLRIGGASLPQTFTNAFPSVPTVGQTVFFVCSHYGDTNISGVTIAGAAAVLDYRSDFGRAQLDVWRATVPASPGRNVVVSGGAGGHFITGSAAEFDALAASPLDRTNTADSTTAAGAATVATAAATTQADELVIAQWTPAFGADDIGTDTASGYTEGWVEDDSNNFQGGAGSFKFVSAIGVQSASWATSTSNGSDYYAQIATYKLASGGEPSPISAVVAATLGALTVNSTLVKTNRAALAATLGALALSATASLRVNAVLNRTLGALQVNALATITSPPRVAVVNAALGTLAAVVTASVLNRAVLSQSLGALTVSSTASVNNRATVNQTLDALAISAQASVPIRTTVNAVLGALQLNALIGSSENHAVVNAVLGELTAVISASIGVRAVLSATLDPLSVNAEALVKNRAVVNAQFGPLQLNGLIDLDDTRRLFVDAVLGELVVASIGSVINRASLNQTLEPVTASISARVLLRAQIEQTLGGLTMQAFAEVGNTPKTVVKIVIGERTHTIIVPEQTSKIVIPRTPIIRF